MVEPNRPAPRQQSAAQIVAVAGHLVEIWPAATAGAVVEETRNLRIAIMKAATHLLAAVERVEGLARGSKARRFLDRPFRYAMAMWYSKIWYRFARKSFSVDVPTIFGRSMTVELPGSIDLYLLGCKTHDSEIRLCKFLIRSLRPGDVFVDVGAHFGFFSLLAARLVGPAGQVFAFEPSVGSFRILQDNVRSAPNTTIINKAVNDCHLGTTEFHEFPARLSEFSSIFVDQLEKERWIDQAQLRSIPTVSLDGYFSERQAAPRVIKIDVEGAEHLVAKGMAQTLRDQKPIVVMEYLNQAATRSQYAQASAQLRDCGYESCVIQSDGNLTPLPDIGRYFSERNIDSENIVFSPPADRG